MSDQEEGFDMSILMPKQEAPAEQEVIEEQEVEQVDEQQELPPDDDAGDSDPKPNKQDLIDKELQRIQQARATYEREIAALQKNPSEKQAERVEKARSRLDAILEAGDNVDPYRAATDLANEVKIDRDRFERMNQQFEAYQREMDERQAQLEAQNARLNFALDYPELRGRYTEFVQKAQQSVEEQLGDAIGGLTAEAYVRLANRELVRMAKEASGGGDKAKPKAEPIKDTAKKPKAATVLQTKSGNSVKPPVDRETLGEQLLRGLVGG